ncbi:MAG TPA: hypothetical protein VEK73_09770 [Xanthobacteraceae bacterium]|nr:hypothetical protein [Xanthobacteraceae bacterium]
MKTLLASALLTAVVLAGMPASGPRQDAQPEGKFTVAQRFCPNGRC